MFLRLFLAEFGVGVFWLSTAPQVLAHVFRPGVSCCIIPGGARPGVDECKRLPIRSSVALRDTGDFGALSGPDCIVVHIPRPCIRFSVRVDELGALCSPACARYQCLLSFSNSFKSGAVLPLFHQRKQHESCVELSGVSFRSLSSSTQIAESLVAPAAGSWAMLCVSFVPPSSESPSNRRSH